MAKTSTLSKLPAEKPKPGRPEGTGFKPTDEQRKLVQALKGYGIIEPEIAKLVINPANEQPISLTTLRTHFHEALETGQVKSNSLVAGFLFKNCEKGNVTAQIFWLKVRAGWVALDELPPPPPPAADRTDMLAVCRQIAYALYLADKDNQRTVMTLPKE